MAKFRFQKNSLIGGEISPTALGRTDLQSYPHSCETLQNMIPMLSGGAYKRPGTIYDDALDANSFLVQFNSASGRQIALAFSASHVKAFAPPTVSAGWMDQITVTGSTPFSGITDIYKMRYAQSGDTLFCVHPSVKPFIVQYSDAGGITIGDFDSTVAVAATKEKHRDAWPYDTMNTNTTYTVVAPAGARNGGGWSYGTEYTFTWSNGYPVTITVGSLIKVYDTDGGPNDDYACYKVTELTNATSMKGTLIVPFNSGNANSTWWASAWGPYQSAREGALWPSCIEFFNGRLCYAANNRSPDSIWFSETNDFFQLSKSNILSPENGNSLDGNPSSIVASDPFTLTLATGKRSRGTWLKAAKELLFGTQAGEYIIDKFVSGEPFWVENSSARKQSDYGSNGVIAYDGNEVFFASVDGTQIRALAFNWQDQAYTAEDIGVLYDVFPTPSITPPSREVRQMVWDRQRSTLWCVDSAGSLVGCTRNKKLGVSAWHSHVLATSPTVQSVCSIETWSPLYVAGGTRTAVDGSMVVIACTLSSGSVLEHFGGDFPRYSSVLSGYFGDPLVLKTIYTDHTITPAKADDLTGGGYNQYDPSTWTLPSLPASAKTISAYGLGKGLISLGSNATVSDANFHWTSLANYADNVYTFFVGFAYTAIIKPVRVEAGSVIGSSQGAMKRIHKIFVRFFRTMYAKVGPDADRLEEIQFRTGSTPMDHSAEYFSGDKEILPQSDYDRDGYVYISSSEPVPMAVLSVAAEGMTYD